MQRRNILGVYIDNCDQEDAGMLLSRFLDETPPALHQVCTVNPEFVMEARRNPIFKGTLNRAALCTPDGVGIILAGKLLRRPFRGRATGVGMVDQLGALSAKGGYSLYLLGAAPGVAEKAAAALQQKHPGATIAGTYSGSPRNEDWPEIRERLWATRPDVLLVAFGAPRQDLWIAEHSIELPPSVKVAMGVGGSVGLPFGSRVARPGVGAAARSGVVVPVNDAALALEAYITSVGFRPVGAMANNKRHRIRY